MPTPATGAQRPPIRLRTPAPEDASAFLAAVAASRRLHAGRVSPPDTRALYRTWLERIGDGSYFGHFLVDDAGELAGVVNLSEVIRGGYQSAFLGYYVFAGYECQGIMSQGLRLVLPRAFGQYRLHRLEAAIQPGNIASRRLVENIGFHLEGVARRSVKIGGRWRDHERWAITAEQWRGRASRRRKT